MKTLKELVSRQQFTDEDDIEIIREWFIANNKELLGIQLMSILADTKAKKDENILHSIKGNICMYAGDKLLFELFDLDIASRLSQAITLFICQIDIKNDIPTLFKWLQDVIPTLLLPQIFWQPFLKWLHENDIYFKGENDAT